MKKENWFPYLYAIIGMIAIQFLTTFYLVGRLQGEMEYLRASVNQLRAPVRNEVVRVRFGLGDKYTGSRVLNQANHRDTIKETKLLTVFKGKLYEMVTPIREIKKCDSKIK